MKLNLRRVYVCLLLLTLITQCVYAQVHVRAYTRKDGTYVPSHYRSSPDGNPYNNWTYPGNTNPYTGKVATGDPDTYLKNYYNKNSGSSSTNVIVTTDPATQELLEQFRKSSQTPVTNTYSTPSYSNSLPKLEPHKILEIKFVKDGAYIRTGPGIQYATVHRSQYFETVEVEEEYSNGWLKVQYTHFNTRTYYPSRRVGYIHRKYVRSSL